MRMRRQANAHGEGLGAQLVQGVFFLGTRRLSCFRMGPPGCGRPFDLPVIAASGCKEIAEKGQVGDAICGIWSISMKLLEALLAIDATMKVSGRRVNPASEVPWDGAIFSNRRQRFDALQPKFRDALDRQGVS